MQILERRNANWVNVLIDIGELQLIYDNMNASDIKHQVGQILLTIQD
jgi:hypothetical protein